jgi:tryptophan synthase alpha chain
MIIKEVFDRLNRNQEMVFIAYITMGFPSLKKSIENLQTLSNCGADIIEIGVPFSDPIADGPTIQYSSQIALKQRVTLQDIIYQLKRIEIDKPLILMSYLNPLLAYGKERILVDIKESGISAIIIPDLPVEEADKWCELAKNYKIEIIFFVAPTSTNERISLISTRSDSFIYCVSITGTTGVREKLSEDVIKFIKRVKRITNKPIAVGFGISTPEQIRFLHGKADGVIVGSRIIEAIRQNESLEEIVKNLKSATRRK